jgi:PAS domain S-box-containing protein
MTSPRKAGRPAAPDPKPSDAPAAPSLFEVVSAASLDGFVVTSTDRRLLGCNERLFQIWGIGPEERDEVRRLDETVEGWDALIRLLSARTAKPVAPAGAYDLLATRIDELPLFDGRVLELYAAPTFARDGTCLGRIVFFRDISRRSRAEGELRERARQQAALAALGELAMNAEDVEPLLHAATATVAEMLRVDAAALVERGPDGPRLRAAFAVPLDAIVLKHARVDGEGGLLAHLGFRSSCEVALPGRDAEPRVLGAYARAPRDCSPDELRFVEAVASVLASAIARHRAEQDMLDRERQMSAVFDGALDAMLLVADDGRVVDANPAACALFGTARPSLPGRSLDELAPVLRTARGDLTWRALLGGGRASGEAAVARPGEKPRNVELSIVPGILPGRSLVVLRDVTEKRVLAARLALADRMASVGTLAAGVAHELNNPLAYVNANLAFVADRLPRVAERLSGDPPRPGDAPLAGALAEAIRDARDGAERLRLIVRDLRTFSRADEDRTGPVMLAPVIESCINMAWNEIRHRARLAKDLAPVPPVHGSEARLGQVFLNLLVNAAQAIPEGNADAHEICVATRALADGRVAVEVGDTGCGIAPEQLPRIFDPFYTTKPLGVGTGLGLSICHGIVTSLGGEIEVDSAPGAGSTFRVILRPEVEAARPPAPARPEAPRAPRSRLLVVDDEPLVGNVLQRTLQRDHEVVVVQSARAALDRLEAGERFDAILSDLLMPEMSGMDLHRAVAERHPGLAPRMIFLTGGAFTPAARAFLEREPVVCIEQPFELETVRAALARVLAQPA